MSPPGHDPSVLPPDLPVPTDDGAADHLGGMVVPPISLPSTRGGEERVDVVPPSLAWRVIYVYPRTGRPGAEPLVEDWNAIPGARGCTPESCGFRDHAADLRALGADIIGVSTQPTAEQLEAVTRLRLPFPLLSDAMGRLSAALALPTFDVADSVLLKRLTLMIKDGRIQHVFYPVFPPNTHPFEVLQWLKLKEPA